MSLGVIFYEKFWKIFGKTLDKYTQCVYNT